MRVIFIGCVRFSYFLLEKLLLIPYAEVIGIVTKDVSTFNSDFCSLKSLAISHDIPFYIFQSKQDALLELWVNEKKPDVIYCFGWPYLLPNTIIKIPTLGIIGYHPSALPQNRGRHPIVWALALGLKETASSFFFIDSAADSGDILSQNMIEIHDNDDAQSLYDKLISVAVKQMVEFTKLLNLGTYQRISQDAAKSNLWRKRNSADGIIDWRMSSQSIYNLIRALTHPYIGAGFYFNGNEYKVWKAEVGCDAKDEYSNIEPGKILKINGSQAVVRCGEGTVHLIDHSAVDILKEGMYL